jgi:hypothetical protein
LAVSVWQLTSKHLSVVRMAQALGYGADSGAHGG